MRKLTILALVAMLTIAGSAFAERGNVFGVAPNATFTNGNNPTTTNNDDSCDIGVYPAATLLLPIFDVDLVAAAGAGETTLFTITNVSSAPQIAHVTVWTDWSFPILDFNIFLTGYDVQSIDMRDILVRELVAPGGPGTSSTSTTISPRAPQGSVAGAAPGTNTSNPNIPNSAVVAGGSCSGTNLPGILPADLMAAVRSALTTGVYVIPTAPGVGCTSAQRVGGVHTNARGYVTIDVAAVCSINLPDDPDYIDSEILFDNVLIGDYQQVNGAQNFAQGNPMVHIRAIPEGGPAGSNPGTNLPYTFYDRYTTGTNPGTRTRDRRQPLPSTFAARWIEGGTSGFNTNYKIWREGLSFGTQSCTEPLLNSAMPVADIIRFDERENSFGFVGGVICSPTCAPAVPVLPEASIVSTANTSVFPANGSTVDVSGWMYLNLNNGGSSGYSADINFDFTPDANTTVRASQNWAIVSMFAQGRFSVDFDAAQLGNGCSAAALDPVEEVGPAGGVFVCPPFTVCVAAGDDHPYSGTNVTP
jgi:hypothetical protein